MMGVSMALSFEAMAAKGVSVRTLWEKVVIVSGQAYRESQNFIYRPFDEHFYCFGSVCFWQMVMN